MTTASGPLPFTKRQRLLTPSDFKQVFDQTALRASHRHCLILARHNLLSQGRLGLIIAKKHIPLAVERNRIKRLIRESFRHQQQRLAGIDAIVLARKGLDQQDNAAIHRLLLQLWQKLLTPRP